MAKNWWKLLAAILVLYATVFSFYKPLESGLISTDKSELNTGLNDFNLVGYNTHFKEYENSFTAVLKIDSIHTLQLKNYEILDNSHVSFKADIPAGLPDKVLDLFVSTERDGTKFLPRAFLIKDNSEDASFESAQSIDFVKGQEEAFEFPFQPLIYETIRNLNFHVPMWFTMFVLMGISLVYSLMYLGSGKSIHDIRAADSARVAMVFCSLGLITGSIWARFTWGDWWTNDAKLNGAAVSFLLLAAYFILRKSAEDKSNKGKIAAVYNIISFFMIMALIMVLPRLTGADTLHPGEDGNPAFSQFDLDNNLRMVFYPACAGWIMTGIWIYQLRARITLLQNKIR